MSIAQKLYEGVDIGSGTQGLITYMRTDGVYTAPEAITEARNEILKEYGDKYLPKQAIKYENKVKNAQEAHEAIRPTNPKIKPSDIKNYLTNDEFKLYELIWKRLIASQMSSAILNQVSVEVKSEKSTFKATGSTIKFDGFLALYTETNEESEEKEPILPPMQKDDKLALNKIIDKQHFTEPPASYTEASLVKKMEEIGIGRPSTYATIISVIQDRGYVKLEKKKFVPENRGIVVNEFLKIYFLNYVEYNYTAKLEDDLDVISNGKADWKLFLKNFWEPLKQNTDEVLKVKNSDVINKINSVLAPAIFGYDINGKLKNKCPDCEDGHLAIKAGKYGIFIACTNYPTCKHTEQIVNTSTDEGENMTENTKNEKFEPKTLGQMENKNVYLKKGPYGFYVQLGEDNETPKPKRVSLSKKQGAENTTLEQATELLSLPKTIGKHPENKEDIKVNIGPYGPYIMWNKKFFSVKNDDIMTLTVERALEIIREESNKRKK